MVCVIGELRPKSRFLGNSVSTFMEGENRVYLLGRPEDNGAYPYPYPPLRVLLSWWFLCGHIDYVISMPNMYARGILWGKMFLELGDSCTAKNEATGHYAEIQFKTKVTVGHLLTLAAAAYTADRDTSPGRTTRSRGAYAAGIATLGRSRESGARRWSSRTRRCVPVSWLLILRPSL